MMSSLSASFTPSARDCSSPHGPTRLGPGRDCIRADDLALGPDREQRRPRPGRRRRTTALPSTTTQPLSWPKSAVGLSVRHLTATSPPARGSVPPSWVLTAPFGVPIRTTSPAAAPSVARTVAAAASWSAARPRRRASSVTTSGSVMTPVGVLTLTWSPSATPSPLGGRPRTAGPPAGARCRPGTARRPAAGRRRAAAARSPAPPAAGPGRGGCGRRLLGCGRARRLPRLRARSSSAPDLLQRRAARASTSSCVGERVEHPAVGHRVRCSARPSNGRTPALPVQERAGLLGERRHRQHDVGPLGHRAGAHLQADHERRRSSARRASAGSGRSSGSTPPTTQRRRAGRRARRRGSPRCRGRARSGSESTPHAAATSARAAASPTGRPPGSRSAARRPRPRPARRRGAAPRPAGRRSRGQPRRGGQRAGHVGQPLADEDHRTGLAQRRRGVDASRARRAVLSPCAATAASTSASVPGAALSSGAGSLLRPRVANGATDSTRSAACAHALRSRRKRIGRLLLRLQPDEQHRPGAPPGRA